MDHQKLAEIATDLIELAKKHNVMLIMGGQQDPKFITYGYDGFGVFIADGKPSISTEIENKSMNSDSSTIMSLTLSKNRFVKNINEV